MVEPHAACALHYRFKDYGRKLVGMLLKQSGHRLEISRIPLAAETTAGLRGKKAHREGGAEGAMHPRDRIADAHGVPCIAVVAVADCGEIGLTMGAATAHGGLNRHFHGHLGSHRA